MDLDGSKQLDERARSEIAQVKQQLEAQVYCMYLCIEQCACLSLWLLLGSRDAVSFKEARKSVEDKNAEIGG